MHFIQRAFVVTVAIATLTVTVLSVSVTSPDNNLTVHVQPLQQPSVTSSSVGQTRRNVVRVVGQNCNCNDDCVTGACHRSFVGWLGLGRNTCGEHCTIPTQ
eukprot:Pgem_evm1s1453